MCKFERSARHYVWDRKGVDGGWLERHVHLHLDDVEGGERRPVHVALALVDEDGRRPCLEVHEEVLVHAVVEVEEVGAGHAAQAVAGLPAEPGGSGDDGLGVGDLFITGRAPLGVSSGEEVEMVG